MWNILFKNTQNYLDLKHLYIIKIASRKHNSTLDVMLVLLMLFQLYA